MAQEKEHFSRIRRESRFFCQPMRFLIVSWCIVTSLILVVLVVNQQEFKATLSMLLKPGEKTYTQRCRLFIGNLPNDITEEDFKKLFAKYGEPSEVFINKSKGFGFIRLVSCYIVMPDIRTLHKIRPPK